jgi:hypothetical protein
VRFVLAFIAARIPRYLGLALLGQAMGDDAIGYLRANVWYLAAFAAVLLLVLMVLARFADRNHSSVTATK